MIRLRDFICEIIAEKMSYLDLMKASDPTRMDKSKRIPAKSLVVKSINDKEAWKFSFKSPRDENYTNQRHQGFIYFSKEGITPNDDVMNIDCSVDCSCPDYKYRWAYNNARADAGEIGGNSLNKNNGAAPQINLGVGLCKHLLSLKEYLRTKIGRETEPTSEPSVDPNKIEKPVIVPTSPDPNKIPPEEPEIDQPEQEPNVTDPTQTPDPDNDKKLTSNPVPNQVDPTQTPQNPEENPNEPEIDVTDDENPDKNKLKESNTNFIYKALDNICINNRIFIIK